MLKPSGSPDSTATTRPRSEGCCAAASCVHVTETHQSMADARGESRTLMGLPPTDFESVASSQAGRVGGHARNYADDRARSARCRPHTQPGPWPQRGSTEPRVHLLEEVRRAVAVAPVEQIAGL